MFNIKSTTAVIISLAGLLLCAEAASGQALKDRVTVHGFLSQAYAGATDLPIHGITTGGTADLRSMALQFRFAATSKDQVVVQLSHRRLGGSPLADLEDTAEIDWAYAQHRLGPVSARVGRFPLARGMFNEVRDVGTVLPFYRASNSVYGEGVETADGVRVDHSVDLGDWEIETMAFYGDFDIKATVTLQSGLAAIETKWVHSVGGQLIVNTPVQGVRLGFTALRATQDEANPDADGAHIWTASGDATFDRFFVRGEYEFVHAEEAVDFKAGYVQAGVRLVRGLWLNAQSEWNTNIIRVPGPAFGAEIKAIHDRAVGLSYAVSPRLVLKVEGHKFDGYALDIPVNPFGAPLGNQYFITSVSTAF